ncbi:MAG: hypothetical protein RLZZ127_2489, partial [Planctomycetota bacterium]
RPGETWIPVRGAGAIVGTGPRITGAAAG